MNDGTPSLVVDNLILNEELNPFGATAEEMMAGILDENGLLGASTAINSQSGKKLCENYYQKRTLFKEATRLGDLLVKADLLTAAQLTKALDLQRDSNVPIGQLIVSLGYCTEEQITKTLSRQKMLRDEFEQMEQAKSEWRVLWHRMMKRLLG